MIALTSDEALNLLRDIASGGAEPVLRDPYQSWDNQTVELVIGGWKMSAFTDATRSRHVDKLTSPDGRVGDFKSWRSDAEYSQQPEDRLDREDDGAVNRMFQAILRAR
jgi:hypothetical protein